LYVAMAQRKDVRRQQLEAQYAARVKVGVGGPMAGQPSMYPGQPGPGAQPMGYYPGVPPQRPFYPPHLMRQWPGQGMMGPINYQLMALNPRGGASGARGGAAAARGGARGGGPGGRGGKQPQQLNGSPAIDQRQYGRDQRVELPQRNQASQGQDSQELSERLTITRLASAPENQRKQMIGERLFPLVKVLQPTHAAKITGMLLEMDNGELLHLLESGAALKDKVDEALQVLQEYAAQEASAQQQ